MICIFSKSPASYLTTISSSKFFPRVSVLSSMSSSGFPFLVFRSDDDIGLTKYFCAPALCYLERVECPLYDRSQVIEKVFYSYHPIESESIPQILRIQFDAIEFPRMMSEEMPRVIFLVGLGSVAFDPSVISGRRQGQETPPQREGL